MTTDSAYSASTAASPQSSAINSLAVHAHWFLRIALAAVFIFHGLDKFMNPAMGAKMIGSELLWLLVGLAEVGGGALVLIGGAIPGRFGDAATRLGALALIPVMIGAIVMVHWGRWSFTPNPPSHPMGGMEFQVTLLLIQFYFLVRGNRAA